MKLAFSGEARYPDFKDGYELYRKKARTRECVDYDTYERVVKIYCKRLAERLCRDGIADLPVIGSIAAAVIPRKPQYRGDKFIGLGKMDWNKGHYDGSMSAFGLVFLPNRQRTENLRCFGFVANRNLFKTMKTLFSKEDCSWTPLDFNENII